MKKEQLVKALTEYPEKLGEGLRTYHQAKQSNLRRGWLRKTVGPAPLNRKKLEELRGLR